MDSLSLASSLSKLERNIMLINQKQATGELIINNNSTQFRLCFFLGQLIYPIKEIHRIRRWQRGLKVYCPDWVVDNSQLISSEIWECEILHRGMIEGHLNAIQVKPLVRKITEEVLFSFNPCEPSNYQWRTCEYAKTETSFYLTLCPLEIKHILRNLANLWQKWQDLGLAYISPELAPVVKEPPSELTQCSADTFLNLTALFNGHYTLWDIAFKMKQPLLRVGRLLHYFYQQGVVELQTVPDLPIPYKVNPQIDSDRHHKKQPIIVCVDDSPLIGKYLNEILTPAGYQLIYIQDPIGGVSTLIKCQPDLIFLDLLMPNTNGYNLCKFLRKISIFRQTPIIMLTAWDGWINRAKAKLVGADDFLAKPFKTEELTAIINKYIST